MTSVASCVDAESKRTISTITEPILEGSKVREFLFDTRRFGSYIATNKQLLQYLIEREKPFTLSSLIDYLDDSLASGDLARTVNRKKCAVKKIVGELILMNPERWSRLDQFFIEKLFRSIKYKKIQTRGVPEEKYLTPEQIDTFLREADTRTRLMILFLISTGCRVSELTRCRRLSAMVFTDSVDILLEGKGAKERHVRITRTLWDQIEKEYRGQEWLFCTQDKNQLSRKWIWRKTKILGERVLGRKIGPHTFRHSFAMMLIASGKDLKAVSDYLGHAGTEVTADMYLHTTVHLDEIPDFTTRYQDWKEAHR